MEPCGCIKDMLGGIDHAAAMIQKAQTEAPNSLLVGAGAMFFSSPELAPDKVTQDQWKAESLAASFADLQLAAWAPGANDFALGPKRLQSLLELSKAQALACNIKASGVNTGSVMLRDVGGVKLGFAGVSVPEYQGRLPEGVKMRDPRLALEGARKALERSGAEVKVALLALKRGQALRLAEAVPGFQVVIVGKPYDVGAGNDAPTPPVLVGRTLVVEAPNHLQALAVVDLYVRDGSLVFADGSGVEKVELKLSLARRVQELSRRLTSLKSSATAKASDIARAETELKRLEAESSQLGEQARPKSGSYFRYELREVREKLGTDPKVVERMGAYYKKVNEHNRKSLGDRKPAPVAKGEPYYVGIEACKECHEDAYAFWKKTGHAKAYETLEVDFKEFNLDCVNCHVTGYEKPGGSTVTFVDKLKDVQCEECHDPGSKHVLDEEPDSILLTPPKALCKKCHHAPHVQEDWDVAEAWTHIIGKGHGG